MSRRAVIKTEFAVERIREYWNGLGMWKEWMRNVKMAEVSGGQVLGRPRLGWMDGVKVALGSRGMTVKAVRQCANDRIKWKALVHM